MGDIRDPERDQPLPRPGGLPVQEIMIRAIAERREYGIRKYGRPLETHNGRDALKDAWEEALDLFTYLTQARLERGDILPGMADATSPQAWRERARPHPEPAGSEPARLGEVLKELIPAVCRLCHHDPHVPGECRSRALGMLCSCGPR